MKIYWRRFLDPGITEAVGQIKEAVSGFKSDIEKKFDIEVGKMKTENAANEVKHNEAISKLQAEVLKMGGSIGDAVNEVKELHAKQSRLVIPSGGRQRKENLEELLYRFVTENQDALIKASNGAQFNDGNGMILKANPVSSGSLANQPYATFLPWQPGMEPIGQFRFRSLVNTIPSDFDTVYFPRANTPVGAGSFSQQKTEGNAKDQVDRGWAMQTVNLYAFAAYLIASRQSLRNIPFMQTWLPTSLNEQLMDAEDLRFSQELVAGATGSTAGITVGSTVNIVSIIQLVTNLLKTKFYANGIAMDANAWAGLLTTKASGSGQYTLPNVVTITDNGIVRVIGIPVYPVNWLQGNRCIVGDWTKASLVESEGLTFRQTDAHASTFIANQVTFLLERVEELAIFRPDAFATVVLTGPNQ